MGFNNAIEQRKFESEWTRLRRQYRAAGFSEDGIAVMYAYDREAYRSERRFADHTQPFPPDEIGDDSADGGMCLFTKFETLTVTFDESDMTSRYAWVDAIGDHGLVNRLKQLRRSDLELLTLHAIEGYSQSEIGHILGRGQATISEKLARIKKFLKFL